MRIQSDHHGLDVNQLKRNKKIVKEEILVLNKGCRENNDLAKQL